MKKNGFTLAELLITLSLLVVIGLIIANNVVALTNHQNDNEYKDFKKSIEKAACVYAGLDKMKAECGNTNCIITIGSLISEGLIDDNLYNPQTDSEVSIDATVFVQNDNGKKTCYYSEDNASYDFIGPNVTINKVYGLVEITVADTNKLGKYEINTSPKNMNSATSFGNVKSKTIYFEPKMSGTYYIHATDQYNNFATVSASNSNHPSVTIREADVDTTKPVITIDTISRGVIKAVLYDDLKLKGYTLSDSSNDPLTYTMLYNKTLSLSDIAVGGETKEITLDPITEAGTYYLHAIDYYNNKVFAPIEIEFTKPKISYKTNGTEVTLTLSDNVGLKQYYVTKLSTLPNDAEWISLSDKVKKVTVNTTITETGNYYVYLYDSQDNLESKAIYVDLDDPVVTYEIANGVVNYTITDNGKLSGYKITNSSSTPAEYDPISGKTYTGSFNKVSGQNYYIHVIDTNNNEASVHIT